MIHVGAEPPWRGYSRYGEWEQEPEGWDGVTRWRWIPPDEPRTFLGQLSNVLAYYKEQIRRDLNRKTFCETWFGGADEHAELEP